MELRYKIKEIPDEGLVVSQPIPADLLKDALEGLEPDLAQCTGGIELTLTRAKRDVIVSGGVSAALAVACGACLKPAGVTVRAPINVVYVEEKEKAAPGDGDDDLDAEDVLHYDGEVVDLRPMLREQLILSLPMSVRCKDGCKGLCPVCGGDRNLNDCGHKVELEESPFAALKSLKLE
jgi:DUF177 domain-containing protein